MFSPKKYGGPSILFLSKLKANNHISVLMVSLLEMLWVANLLLIQNHGSSQQGGRDFKACNSVAKVQVECAR